jgi:S1-C subfamily serine protease
LTSRKIEPLEGIYKSYQSDGMLYYKLGIIKVGQVYKAIVIESELKYWKLGEVKAIFEPSSVKGLYAVKWYMANKTPIETFANMDNDALLNIELKNLSTGEKRQDKFIKMFPSSSNDIKPNKDNALSSGSGFFITSDGVIATNSHVVENAKNIDVTVSNEIGAVTYKAKILLVDAQNDVALLKIDDVNFKALNPIPFGITENSDVGSKVFTIGFPLNDIMGTNYKVTDGIISSKSGIADDVRYYQISVPLQPGNSGGPLFNKDGNVIGITTARLNSGAVGTQLENVNYAIKSSYLLNLYKMLSNSTEISSNLNLKSKELQDQVKILKNYVCLIRTY